jgi:hypothetical protein
MNPQAPATLSDALIAPSGRLASDGRPLVVMSDASIAPSGRLASDGRPLVVMSDALIAPSGRLASDGRLSATCTDSSSASWILVKVNESVMGDFAAVATEAMLLVQLRMKGRNAYLDLSSVEAMNAFALSKMSVYKRLLERQGFGLRVVHPKSRVAGALRFAGLGELLAEGDRLEEPSAAPA